ncbi:hypothetical protein [Lentzea sp. E54]|uniref:hypothetical protein n=1 Tax=Lentzea xerophila TaxID=3435883 RepID=UPI003DA69BA2
MHRSWWCEIFSGHVWRIARPASQVHRLTSTVWEILHAAASEWAMAPDAPARSPSRRGSPPRLISHPGRVAADRHLPDRADDDPHGYVKIFSAMLPLLLGFAITTLLTDIGELWRRGHFPYHTCHTGPAVMLAGPPAAVAGTTIATLVDNPGRRRWFRR